MTLALLCGWIGRRSLAVVLFALCLALSIGLFLFKKSTVPNTDSGCRGSRPNSTGCAPRAFMIDSRKPMTTQRLLALLNYVYLSLVIFVIAGILTGAMTLQYANGELPCPPMSAGARCDVRCASASC